MKEAGSVVVSSLLAMLSTSAILLFSSVFAFLTLILLLMTKPLLDNKEVLNDAA